ncbi:hypothetical protein H8F21_13670 [Pseudomonas sp. P66]|uniref:Uncharacterized protein n=1 Tax=Pseudomonas arcuscaelestis TaxID=2710591 RepID=A0ABS2BYC2_9PSED|nr:hypothetical protein [Pseudomonas arcuscaelestis]MBM5458613.1 hypothetical protein [Pseudomonas arcuscaelestis]
MYTKAQLSNLFDLISNLGNVSPTAPSDMAAAQAEVNRLMQLDQEMLLVCHEHRHGVTNYPVLAPRGTVLGEAQMRAMLAEEFEPEIGEYLNYEVLGNPALIE